MSGTSVSRLPNKAELLHAQALDWLDRRDRSTWTEDDQAAFDVWLNDDPMHRISYWRVESVWNHTDRLIALRLPETQRWKGAAILRVAAATVLAAALSLGAWLYLSRPVGTIYTTNVGDRETVVLADKTQIELNTDTSMRVVDSPDDREIWLQKGEAFFQVTHERTRPLTVYVGEQRITDIGTKFDVLHDAGGTKILVVEGRIGVGGVNAPKFAHSLILSRGDVAIVAKGRTSKMRVSALELSSALGWRRGVLVFDNTPLSDAIQQIAHYSPAKIAVPDSKIARLPLTGTVSATDTEEFLRMVRTVFGLHEQKLGDETVISR
jgi:transmembrane sensor